MTPYELLGIDKKATTAEVRSAYRKLSKIMHPDRGGDPEKFRELKEAHDILSDKDRRKRYDRTGRTAPSSVTPARVKAFLAELINSVVNAKTQSGRIDDVTRENIQMKIVMSLNSSQMRAQQARTDIECRLIRAKELIDRFIPMGKDDPIGELLRAERSRIVEELNSLDDEIEIARMAIKIFAEGYRYKADPGTEGPKAPGPTVYHNRGTSTYHFGRGPQG